MDIPASNNITIVSNLIAKSSLLRYLSAIPLQHNTKQLSIVVFTLAPIDIASLTTDNDVLHASLIAVTSTLSNSLLLYFTFDIFDFFFSSSWRSLAAFRSSSSAMRSLRLLSSQLIS